MAHSSLKKIITSFVISMSFLGSILIDGPRKANADEILASLFFQEFNDVAQAELRTIEGATFFVSPLYCPGQDPEREPDKSHPCGIDLEADFHKTESISPTQFSGTRKLEVCEGKCEIIKGKVLCNQESLSCVHLNEARFVANFIDGTLDTFQEGNKIAVTLVEHEPLTEDSCTGRFRHLCAQGKINLNFRCTLTQDDFFQPTFQRLLESAYIISREE